VPASELDGIAEGLDHAGHAFDALPAKSRPPIRQATTSKLRIFEKEQTTHAET
jgi:hypothetical protein